MLPHRGVNVLDLNKLLYNHQIALMNAAASGLVAGNRVKRSERHLRTARHRLGVAQYPALQIQVRGDKITTSGRAVLSL